MKAGIKRNIATLLIAAMLALDVVSPAAAAMKIPEGNITDFQEESLESGQTVSSGQTGSVDDAGISGSGSGTAADTSAASGGSSGTVGGLTEENFQEQAIEAVKRAEAQLAKEGNTLNDYYVSENGSTVVGEVTDADGEKNYILDTDEEFIYDPSHEGEKEGYGYLGTGAESGISIFRTTMSYEELEGQSDYYDSLAALEEDENSLFFDYYDYAVDELAKSIKDNYEEFIEKTDGFIKKADIYAKYIQDTCFEYVGTPSDASKNEESSKQLLQGSTSEEASQDEEDFEDEEDDDDDDEEDGDLSVVSPSDASQKAASPSDASRKSSTGKKASQDDEVDDVYGDDIASSEASLLGGSLSGEEENSEYEVVNNGWALIVPPKYINTSTLQFAEAEIIDCDPVTGVESNGTPQSTKVLIARKDWVYFQVNKLDSEGKIAGGLNKAAISIDFVDWRHEDQHREGTTENYNGTDGYAGFSGMRGENDCFINISIPGYKTQTYYTKTLEGGQLYTFNMEPVQNGEVYLRAAAIQGMDVIHDEVPVYIFDDMEYQYYPLQYMVSVAAETDPAKAPNNVCIRTVPQPKSPKDPVDPLDYRIYRDRFFRPQGKPKEDGTATQEYSLTAAWSSMTDRDKYVNDEYWNEFQRTKTDNVKNIRFTIGNEVFLDLPDGYKWAGTDSKSFKLKIKVDWKVNDPEDMSGFTINLCGMNSGGSSGGGFSFNTDVPGLKNANLNCSLLDFRVMAAVMPSGGGIIGYNVPGSMAGYFKRAGEGGASFKTPYGGILGQRLCDKVNTLVNQFLDNAESLRSWVYSGSRKQWKGMGNITGGWSGFFAGVVTWNKKQQEYSATLLGGLTYWGVGNITGYTFVGPMPVFLGVDAMASATFSGAAGLKFKKGMGKPAQSDLANFTVALNIGITAFAGVGLRGVLGAEVKGGGDIGITGVAMAVREEAKGWTIDAGWNLGYRVYVLFLRWQADFINKRKQLLPKPDSTETGVASPSDFTYDYGYIPNEAEVVESTALILPAAEGQAVSVSNDEDALELLEPYSTTIPANDAPEYTDEAQVTATSMLKTKIAASPAVRYVSNGKGDGVLARIASVKTSTGKIVPRVVFSFVDKDGKTKQEYILPSTTANDSVGNYAAWEKNYEYGYDYGFSVAQDREIGTNVIFFVVASGPVNQEELDQEAIKGKEDKEDAILKCRMEYEHLRVITIDTVNGKILGNDLVEKHDILSGKKAKKSHVYAYIGTPQIGGEISRQKWSIERHWWAASLTSSADNEDGSAGDGYVMSGFDSQIYSKQQTGYFGGDKKYTDLLMIDDSTTNMMYEVYWSNAVLYLVEANVPMETQVYDKDQKKWIYRKATGSDAVANAPRRLWCTTWQFDKGRPGELRSTVYDHKDFNEDINNLTYGTTNRGYFHYGDGFFTCGQDIYKLQYDRNRIKYWVHKMSFEAPDGQQTIIPVGDGILKFFDYHGSNQKIKIVAARNRSGEVKNGENPEKYANKSDIVITIYDAEYSDGGTYFKLLGQTDCVVHDKAITRMDGGFIFMDETDNQPSIRVYYLANKADGTSPVESEQDAPPSEYDGDIETVNEYSNLYVWNWVAAYGVKLNKIYPQSEVADYDLGKFNLKLDYQNIGPKLITDAVKVEWYSTFNKTQSEKHTVEIAGEIKQGESKTSSISIPINKDWNGWVNISAAITEVKVNGKWYTAEEAGFKPVWVDTGKLKGKLHLNAETTGTYDAKLSIDEWKASIASPERLRVKIYKERITQYDVDTGTVKTAWDKNPSQILEINAKMDKNYTWNMVMDMTNIDYWFKGFYTQSTSGDVQLTDINQAISKVEMTEIISSVKFELVGWGDDTWNVEYDNKVLTNPMLDHLGYAEVEIKNKNAGVAYGGGYFLSKAGAKVHARVETAQSYRVKYWTADIGAGEVEIEGSKDKSILEYTPAEGTHYLKLTAVVVPEEHHSVLHLRNPKDQESREIIGDSYATDTNGQEFEYTTDMGDGTKQYTFDYAQIYSGKQVTITAQFDRSRYHIAGWAMYRVESAEELGSFEVNKLGTQDPTVNDYQGPEPNEIIASDELTLPIHTFAQGTVTVIGPIIKAGATPKVTFNPAGGILTGAEEMYVRMDGTLEAESFNAQSALWTGHKFLYWADPNGAKITQYTVFTGDTEVTAVYEDLIQSELWIRANDPDMGAVSIDGLITKSLIYNAYKDTVYLLDALPEEGYKINDDKTKSEEIWEVYSRDGKGNFTVKETTLPKYSEAEGKFCYTMPDRDVLIIAKFVKKAEDKNLYIRLKTDTDESGHPVAVLSASVPAGMEDQYKITCLSDGRYQVARKEIQDVEIVFEATIDPALKDRYGFEGWRKYTISNEGEIVLGDFIGTVEKLRWGPLSDDGRFFACWQEKKTQSFEFEKKSVTIRLDQPAGPVNQLKTIPIGTVTYSCENPEMVTIDPVSGDIKEVKKAGTTRVTATVPASAEYTKSSASYTLVIKKLDQKIYFNETEKTMSIGDQQGFTQVPEGVKSGKVHYLSNDSSVAKVDTNTGHVTPSGTYGTATITAVAESAEKYYESRASYKVTVTGLEQKIAFAFDTKNVTYGCESFTVTPSDAVGKVTYSSTKSSVASVDAESGKVTVKSAGTATIVAVAGATARYLQSDPAAYQLIVARAAQNLVFGRGEITVRIGDEPFKNSLSGLKTTAKYTSSDPERAAVNESTGVVTPGLKKGNVTITVTAGEDERYESASKSYSVTVLGRKQDLKFEKDVIEMTYGDPAMQNPLSGAVGKVTYAISPATGIATVDENGCVTAVGAGTATVTATAAGSDEYEEQSISYTLKVRKAKQDLKWAENSMTIASGQGGFENEILGAKTAVTCTSSNAQVVKIAENGKIYGVSKGDAVLYAVAEETSQYYKATAQCSVRVDPAENDIYFLYPYVSINVNEPAEYPAVLNEVKNLFGRSITGYTSSDPGIVEVDAQTGAVSKPKKSGVVTITAQSDESGEYKASKATYVLRVNKVEQNLQFAQDIVQKKIGDDPFTNALTGAKSAASYTSSHSDVADADETSGEITIHEKAGNTVITALVTEADDSLYETASKAYLLLVEALEQKPVFQQEEVTLEYGTGPFTQTVKNAGEGTEVVYYSSDPSVASVDQLSGEVSIHHPGEVTIRAKVSATAKYKEATASYTLTVIKGTQNPTFKDRYLSKKLSDPAFINEVIDAEGKVSYTVSDPSKASIDANGKITMLDVGAVTFTAKVAETEYYAASYCVFTLLITKGVQHPYFAQTEPACEYGTAVFKNELKEAHGTADYYIVSYEPREGMQKTTPIADINKVSGDLIISGAGTVKVAVNVTGDERYEAATAMYELMISPKNISKTAILAKEDTINVVVVYDGNKILEEGVDYKLTWEGIKGKTVYTVSGIGNYFGQSQVVDEKVYIIEGFMPELSPNLPKEQYAEASEMVSKVEMSGFKTDTRIIEEVKKAVTGIGENKITPEDMENATDFGIIIQVEVMVEKVDDAASEYRYSLDPYAIVIAWQADGSLVQGITDIDPGWLDGTRNIFVKLGVGNYKKAPNRVIHQSDSGVLIDTYTKGSRATGKQFLLSEDEKTVSFYIEHCSDIIIRYVESPASAGEGGGTGWIWSKDNEGYWHLRRGGHTYKDEWVYAFNPYADTTKGQTVWNWFSFDEKGRMRTGWFKDKTERWYYLEKESNGSQGAMYYNRTTPDGYFVDASGAWDTKPAKK